MDKITRNLIGILGSVLFGIPLVIWCIATIIKYKELLDSKGEEITRSLIFNYPKETSIGSLIVVVGLLVIVVRGLFFRGNINV